MPYCTCTLDDERVKVEYEIIPGDSRETIDIVDYERDKDLTDSERDSVLRQCLRDFEKYHS